MNEPPIAFVEPKAHADSTWKSERILENAVAGLRSNVDDKDASGPCTLLDLELSDYFLKEKLGTSMHFYFNTHIRAFGDGSLQVSASVPWYLVAFRLLRNITFDRNSSAVLERVFDHIPLNSFEIIITVRNVASKEPIFEFDAPSSELARRVLATFAPIIRERVVDGLLLPIIKMFVHESADSANTFENNECRNLVLAVDDEFLRHQLGIRNADTTFNTKITFGRNNEIVASFVLPVYEISKQRLSMRARVVKRRIEDKLSEWGHDLTNLLAGSPYRGWWSDAGSIRVTLTINDASMSSPQPSTKPILRFGESPSAKLASDSTIKPLALKYVNKKLLPILNKMLAKPIAEAVMWPDDAVGQMS